MASPTIDPQLATDFSIAADTPHVIVYRFFIKHPGDAEWTRIGDGHTNDDVSDHYIVMPPLASGSQFGYWLGVAGHLNTTWRATFTVAQHGATVPGGEWEESGATSTPAPNGMGSDQRYGTVTL